VLRAPPQTPLRFSDLRMCNHLTPVEHFWLMLIIRNFGAKRNLYFKFSAPPSSLSKDRSCATERGWRLSTLQTNATFKKMEYSSQHNLLQYECYQCQKKYFSPRYLFILFKVQLSSEYVLKLNSEKGWQKSLFILNGMQTNTT